MHCLQHSNRLVIVLLTHWFLKLSWTQLEKLQTSTLHQVSLQVIMFVPTHAFATYIQINHFYDYRCDYPPQHLVKTTCSHIKWFVVAYVT
jgi:hypothetical protein